MNEKMETAVSTLEGLTPNEWMKIRSAVDESLRIKRKELDRTIKLSSDEIAEIIQILFG